MITFLKVHLALVSLPLYFLVAWLASPPIGAAVALACAMGQSYAARRWAPPPVFEVALVTSLFVIVLGAVFGAQAVVGSANGIMLLGLGAGAALSVAIGKPWTAEFSASEYGGASKTPLFRSINNVLSAMWAVLFLWLGTADFLAIPPLAHWLPVVFGSVASILLPKIAVSRSLQKQAAGDQRNNWPAPNFSADRVEDTTADETCDVAVVGAGLGGLTAAALLADAGFSVAVFEQHILPGGFSHTWLRRTRDPQTGEKLVFRFDSGVHDVSGWQPGGPVRSIFTRLGIAENNGWERLQHRYILDQKQITVSASWQTYVDDLAHHYPEQADGLRALFAEIHEIYQAMYASSNERGGIPGSPTTPQGLLAFARNNPLAIEWMDRPWNEFVARHLTDEGALKWIAALTGYITDTPERLRVAQMVPLFGYYFNGGYYPIGGSGKLADSLVTAIEQRNGSVHLGHRVQSITTDNARATGLVVTDRHNQQRRVAAKAVVCNADLRIMLDNLLNTPEISNKLEGEVGAVAASCSAVAVHLGIRGALDLPPVIHVDGEHGSAGIVIPSAVDPSCAPEGYATIEAMRLLTAHEAKEWFPDDAAPETAQHKEYRRSKDYLQRKQQVTDELLACVRKFVPDLDARIVYRCEASPITYQRYSQTTNGAIYGVTTAQNTPPTRTPLQNLVLAGAATHGPGVEAVVISGAHAADALVPGILAAASSQTSATTLQQADDTVSLPT